jgi:hypothetical protein
MFKSLLVLKKDCCADASVLAVSILRSRPSFTADDVVWHGCWRAAAGVVRCGRRARLLERELLQLTSEQWRAGDSGD